MKILCYISSHGFGHATRTFATLRELLRYEDTEIILRANLPRWLVTNSFQTERLTYEKGFETLTIFYD
ncbi:MAG: hypothetical protein GF329_04135, partial [Candidatus Lokiarchaeota archaeon]|nr:hypothetical protein [Candidatus Lokiarchaeota archaeon]